MENRATGSSLDSDQAVAKYYGDYITEVTSAANPRFAIFWCIEDRWYRGMRIPGIGSEESLSQAQLSGFAEGIAKGFFQLAM
jgi:hypothetical protein